MNKSKHYRGGFEYSGSLRLAREFRQTSTEAESFLWNRLRNRQLLRFKFRLQHQLGLYIVDFYCKEADLVIECDGGIHSKNETWHHDQSREAYMSTLGLRTLRFTNNEVLEETERVLNEISDYLRAAQPRPKTQEDRSR
jgi:type I restriction enzyme, R subunit